MSRKSENLILLVNRLHIWLDCAVLTSTVSRGKAKIDESENFGHNSSFGITLSHYKLYLKGATKRHQGSLYAGHGYRLTIFRNSLLFTLYRPFFTVM